MRRGVLAGLALVALVSGTTVAGGRLRAVTGHYTYDLNGGTSHVQLVAFEDPDGATGSLTFPLLDGWIVVR